MHTKLPYTPRRATLTEFAEICLKGHFTPGDRFCSVGRNAILYRAWWLYHAAAETDQDPAVLFDDWFTFAQQDLLMNIAEMETLDKFFGVL